MGRRLQLLSLPPDVCAVHHHTPAPESYRTTIYFLKLRPSLGLRLLPGPTRCYRKEKFHNILHRAKAHPTSDLREITPVEAKKQDVYLHARITKCVLPFPTASQPQAIPECGNAPDKSKISAACVSVACTIPAPQPPPTASSRL